MSTVAGQVKNNNKILKCTIIFNWGHQELGFQTEWPFIPIYIICQNHGHEGHVNFSSGFWC